MPTIDATTTQTGAGYPALQMRNDSQTQQGTTNFTSNQNGAQNPIFTAAQQGMQGQAQNLYSQILSGDVQNFGLDQATRDAAWFDFQQNQLPLLSAQHGVGSPALNAAAEQLNLRLAGMSGQMAIPNAINAANGLSGVAFNPVGYTTNNTSTQNQVQNQTNEGTSATANVGGVLGGLSDWLNRFFP